MGLNNREESVKVQCESILPNASHEVSRCRSHPPTMTSIVFPNLYAHPEADARIRKKVSCDIVSTEGWHRLFFDGNLNFKDKSRCDRPICEIDLKWVRIRE